MKPANPDSKKRTVTLSKKANEDLETLCEHLGINPHSYLMGEIVKAVQRDLMTYTSKTAMTEMVKQMEEMQRKLN